MSLDKSDLQKMAWLARLTLDETDTDSYLKDLSRILDLVERMNSVDTTNVEPMAHPLELKARLRADAVTEPDNRDKFQSIAPSVEAGLYLVPRVIE